MEASVRPRHAPPPISVAPPPCSFRPLPTFFLGRATKATFSAREKPALRVCYYGYARRGQYWGLEGDGKQAGKGIKQGVKARQRGRRTPKG